MKKVNYDHRVVEAKWPLEKTRGKQSGSYDHAIFDKKWQEAWDKKKLYVPDLAASKRPFDRAQGKPFYNLMMFPYPSAEGLHVGNMYAFTGSDIYGRFKRMQGYEVFEPIGLDGFGIHSENYALKLGKHPMDQAKVSEKNFYRQLATIGCMFDWTRTVETYDPDYYKWTQWIFVQMFKHGLAYRGKAEVNWCPSCKTVLADEQVIDARPLTPESRPTSQDEVVAGGRSDGGRGACERCGNIVEKRLLEQWFFRITAYAEKLLQNTFSLNWSEKVLVAQRNWIGKKEGVIVHHIVKDLDLILDAFSAYPAWLFADTFLVLAPDHPQVEALVRGTDREKEVLEYIKRYKNSKKNTRTKADEKEGIFTGRHVVDPFSGKDMPVWLANFALMEFGTGIIRCSAHDPRDYEFAQKYKIQLKEVVNRDDSSLPVNAHENKGVLKDSGPFTGRSIDEKLIHEMIEWIIKEKIGKREITYHLRDWLISRQRYWGPPIPMVYCQTCADQGRSWFTTDEAQRSEMGSGKWESKTSYIAPQDPASHISSHTSMYGWYPVQESDLPVELPYIEDYKPGDDGVAPLAKHKEFYETKCPGCGGKAVRETDVSDTFLDSSWYFLRYPSIGGRSGETFFGDAQQPKFASSKNLPSSLNEGSSPKKKGASEVHSGRTFSAPQNAHPRARQRSSGFPAPSQEPSLEIRNLKLEIPWDPEVTRRWLPVDMYTGGAEHSVLHLMYSRFVWMCLRDWGYLDFSGEAGPRSAWDEPFPNFYAHGLVIKDGAKMSKSKGNVVNPDEYIKLYGTDALRLYLMFMGPFDLGGDFRDSAMEGMYRWVNRVWRLEKTAPAGPAIHKLIKKVTQDIEKRRYNTAIAAMMEFTNLKNVAKDDFKKFILLLAPFAPHLAEELWARAGGKSMPAGRQVSVHEQPWPTFDPKQLEEDTVFIIVQINGKLRATCHVSRVTSHDQKEVEKLAKSSEKVEKYLTGQTIKKAVFVPGKLINFVTT